MKKQLLLPLLALLLILTGCTKAACKTHSDNNGDDICDICGDSVIVVVDFYCINDLHGRILDTVAQPGIDELTTFLENARQTDDHVVMLSSGDMWQGSAESNMTRGKLVTDWMNAMDFQAMALGNHEFDWGEEYIEQNAKLADFPFLAINIFDSTTKKPVDYCVPSLLMDCSGIQIGLIGAIGDHLSSIAPDMTEGIYFETGSALTELVKAESQSLREKGADFIVYILHDGGSSGHGSSNMAGSYNISLSDGYVDLVFEGHSHQQYIYKDSFGVPHLQNGGDNTGGLSHAEVSIHAINGTVTVRETDLVTVDAYAELEDSPVVEDLLKRYDKEIAPAVAVVGDLEKSVPGDALRQLVADLYYMEGLRKWGTDYDIALGGGFVSIRNPGYLAKGEVTYGDLLELFPFDNELVLCSIRGRDLNQRFLDGDNSNYFICCDESQTNHIDNDAIYYVVVDSYSSTYGPNRLTEIERYGEAYYARDMLADFIQNGGLN